jgi:ABC-type antimicrobial peptide transport system permease subunit
MVNILVIFLLTIALLTAVVGSTATGTMGMNVLERTREIGVMCHQAVDTQFQVGGGEGA